MNKGLFSIVSLSLLANFGFASETQAHPSTPSSKKTPMVKPKEFIPFTGKVVGNKVRMRLHAALDGDVISELGKETYIVITGEKGDFYSVKPPKDLKAYIFRGFVIDGIVEGDRVNVRLAPDREAPIISQYNKGTPVKETIAPDNSRWLEIPMPEGTRFYIAKEYVEYAGNVELKEVHEKRKASVAQLLEEAELFAQSELSKTFLEIDMDKITQKYQHIIEDYSDFSNYTSKAQKALAKVRENYLHLKIAFLENKASQAANVRVEENEKSLPVEEISEASKEFAPSIDRIKVWEPIEESLYLTWAHKHHAKSMEDFYENERLQATTIRGFLHPYSETVKNKPGDFILKNRDISIAYLYSTHVNLQDYVDKEVTLVVSPRSNNQFAFPAFYVLEIK